MSLDDNLQKIPPQNLEAESSTLGGILLENESIKPVLEIVRPEDFYRHSHQKIFRAMIELSERREPVDLITLSDFLKGKNELEAVGGSAYLASLADFTPTAANVSHYARIVRERAILRSLITVATEVATRGYQEPDATEELLSKLKNGTSEIEARLHHNGNGSAVFVKLSDVQTKKLRWLWHSRIPLGKVTVLDGDPGLGKSLLSIEIATCLSTAKPMPNSVKADLS